LSRPLNIASAPPSLDLPWLALELEDLSLLDDPELAEDLSLEDDAELGALDEPAELPLEALSCLSPAASAGRENAKAAATAAQISVFACIGNLLM
jgi:hypothetical protein